MRKTSTSALSVLDAGHPGRERGRRRDRLHGEAEGRRHDTTVRRHRRSRPTAGARSRSRSPSRKTKTTVGKKVTVKRRIVSISVPVYPNHTDRSIFINQQALPYLMQEALQAQSTNIQLDLGRDRHERRVRRSRSRPRSRRRRRLE